MQRSDSLAFAQLLAGLAETFDVALTPTRTELYFRALEDLPLAAVREAVSGAIRDGRFFPKPAELRARVEPNLGDQAEIAWLALTRYFDVHGYEWHVAAFPLWTSGPMPETKITEPDVDAITEAVVLATWGGYGRAYECWRRWSEYELDRQHRDFIARYLAYGRTPRAQRPALPGMRDPSRAVTDGRH